MRPQREVVQHDRVRRVMRVRVRRRGRHRRRRRRARPHELENVAGRHRHEAGGDQPRRGGDLRPLPYELEAARGNERDEDHRRQRVARGVGRIHPPELEDELHGREDEQRQERPLSPANEDADSGDHAERQRDGDVLESPGVKQESRHERRHRHRAARHRRIVRDEVLRLLPLVRNERVPPAGGVHQRKEPHQRDEHERDQRGESPVIRPELPQRHGEGRQQRNDELRTASDGGGRPEPDGDGVPVMPVIADAAHRPERQPEERDRGTVGKRERAVHQHARRKIKEERAADREIGIVDPVPEGAGDGHEADDRGDDADDHEAAPRIVDDDVDDLAEEDIERIAGRMGVISRGVEALHPLGEQKLVVLPRRARHREDAGDQNDGRPHRLAPPPGDVLSAEC